MPITKLRGERYIAGANDWLPALIENELHGLDFDETRSLYAYAIRACGFGPKAAAQEERWKGIVTSPLNVKGQALLGCNDRYYLLTGLLKRADLNHPWLFERCREVEADPDGHMDLWSRGHYKSTIITFAGNIQDIVCDPEIKIAIFSVVKPIAQAFLAQIKDEFENNDELKTIYSDVLYQEPRKKDSIEGRPSKWGLARGITVKRKTNPKEATIEAHGLLDGQPTSRHFDKHGYDDIVTQDYLSEEQIRKTMSRYEMADNLGTHTGVRKQIAGTYYHFNDCYVQIRDRRSLKPRIYPATDNGKLDGKPVFLTNKRWAEIKRDQRSTVAAQMLLNPVAGNEATFQSEWLRPYEVIPSCLNVYILCDPSLGTQKVRSDRTAIVVIGVDQGGNKYLLDGIRHKMGLSDRWRWIKSLREKWMNHPGVQEVRVGYERYGMQVDLEVIADIMERERIHFEIVELGTPKQGGHAKPDRIKRLEPDIRNGQFYIPNVIYSADHGGACFWNVWTEAFKAKAEERGLKNDYIVGEIVYRQVRGLTKLQAEMDRTGQKYRIVAALKRINEDGDIYDLTKVFNEELIRHPFAAHDDMIDAVARIYDIEPRAPEVHERSSTDSLESEAIENMMETIE